MLRRPNPAIGGMSREQISQWMEVDPTYLDHAGSYRVPNGNDHDVSDSDSDDEGVDPLERGDELSNIRELERVLEQTNADSGNAGHHHSYQQRKQSSLKLHALPPHSAPLGLMAELALDSDRERRESHIAHEPAYADARNEVGPANETYFNPGPVADPDLRSIIIERHLAPEILTTGLVTLPEVEKLLDVSKEQLDELMNNDEEDSSNSDFEDLMNSIFSFTIDHAVYDKIAKGVERLF